MRVNHLMRPVKTKNYFKGVTVVKITTDFHPVNV